ncbi:MAG TPA: carbonic anhydrase [Polyangia bacterium]|jgi:carbonic anhydrase|nr:carbonic anhydrase [Polyangia bacterium]
MYLDDWLTKNREWAARMVAEDPDYFRRHVGGQKPRLLWIGCSDSRVLSEQIIGANPGELFVHRNIANIVSYNDVNLASVVQYAVEHLKVQDIVVCGHYGCGGVKAACEERVVSGYVGDWLMIAGWAKRWVEERLAQKGGPRPSEERFLQMVVEENVRLQVKHLSALSMVREAWERHAGFPRLHAWVYDIHTGHILQVDEPHTGPKPPQAKEQGPPGDAV